MMFVAFNPNLTWRWYWATAGWFAFCMMTACAVLIVLFASKLDRPGTGEVWVGIVILGLTAFISALALGVFAAEWGKAKLGARVFQAPR